MRVALKEDSRKYFSGDFSWDLLEFSVVAAILFFYFLYINNLYLFFIFQDRDLFRASELLAGKSIFWGPETTGGGTLPGGAYYYLLAIIMSISRNVDHIWLAMLGLNSLGMALIYFLIKKKYGLFTASILMAMFISSGMFFLLHRLFMNLSFSIFFIALALWSYHWSNYNSKKSIFISGVLSAILIQFHYSLILTPIFFFNFKKTPRVLIFATGFLLIYGIYWFDTWLAFGEQRPSALLLDNRQSLLTIFQLLKRGVSIESIFPAEYLLRAISFIVPVGVIIITFLSGSIKFGAQFDKRKIAIILLTSSVLIIYASVVSIGYRYLIPVFLFFNILVAQIIGANLESNNLKKISVFLMILFCILLYEDRDLLVGGNFSKEYYDWLINRVLAFFSFCILIALRYFREDKFFYRKVTKIFIFGLAIFLSTGLQSYFSSDKKTTLSYHFRKTDWVAVNSWIAQKTGWDFSKQFLSTYYINLHLEAVSPISKFIFSRSNFFSPGKIDGAIVGTMLVADSRIVSNMANAQEWVLNQNIPQDLADAIRNNKIQIVETALISNAIILLYKLNGYPHLINNSALGYFSPLQKRKFSSNTLRWNLCRDKNAPECALMIDLEVQKLHSDNYNIRLDLYSDVLSQRSEWVYPSFVGSLEGLYLDVKCNNQNKRLKIIDSIGYNRKFDAYQWGIVYSNNSILAPLKSNIEFKCSARPILVGIGAEKIIRLSKLDEHFDNFEYKFFTDK